MFISGGRGLQRYVIAGFWGGHTLPKTDRAPCRELPPFEHGSHKFHVNYIGLYRHVWIVPLRNLRRTTPCQCEELPFVCKGLGFRGRGATNTAFSTAKVFPFGV